MNAEPLGTRTSRLIKGANISPRILAAVTKIHYTTIYAIIKDRSSEETAYPSTLHILNTTLDRLEKLIEEGKLPFTDDLSHTARTTRLTTLLDES